MIEALQAFRKGWDQSPTKDNHGKHIPAYTHFEDFFTTERAFFPKLAPHAKLFYKNIRCGILHQAEITGGFRILLKKDGTPQFDPAARTINAYKFMKGLKDCLGSYIDELKTEEMGALVWRDAMKKLDFICKNCRKDKSLK
jgi:hypothetical protein